jgi:(1->4)-alpha-D-glucan 1-alpha-D-glucosylmutase
MRKAIKEAKTHSSWVNENQPYEDAMAAFVEATLRGSTARAFLAAFSPLQRRIARFGAVNSLAQLVLKLTSPGVVDLYQGTELWDLHLVDPDNRQPVDFKERRALLDTLESAKPEELLANWTDGRIKMFILAKLLRLRREMPNLFLEGDYVSLRGLDEESGRHLVAFSRRLGSRVLTVMVPRLTATLAPTGPSADGGALSWPVGFSTWKTMHVELPDNLVVSSYQNILTGATVRALNSGGDRMLVAADIFKTLPVAVLVGDIVSAA